MGLLEKLFGRGGAAKEPPRCPYCGVILPKRPQRKTKCKSCGRYMYVRKHPKTGKPTIMTEGEASAIKHGFTIEEYTRMEAEMKRRFGREASTGDVIWGLYNNKLNRLIQINDFQSLRSIYYEMALFLNSEGKNPFQMLQQAAKMYLLDLKQEGYVKKVEIIGGECESCQQLTGKVYTIKEALEKMPIPNKDCTFHLHGGKYGFCRCIYGPAIEKPVKSFQ
jgi:hypothetical protein